MKAIGIWMDKEKAHVVELSNDGEHLKTIPSEMEFYHPKGGSRSKTRWGPQEVISERSYLEREQYQMKQYFKKLAQELHDADAIAVFGPADTNFKFEKELYENYAPLARKLKKVAKVDSMTMNQIKALVRNFFKKGRY